MKKSIMAVTLACTCACMMGLVGCGGSGNTNTNNANTANNTTAAAAVNTGSATASGNSGNTTATTGTTSTAANTNSSAETGTPEAAIEKATSSGVTTKSADEMQNMMDNTLNVGMTLSDARAAMGCDGTLMGDGYNANTYAWYSADKSKAIIATFTGQDASSTLTSCEIGID